MKYAITFFLESPRKKNKDNENPILPIMMNVSFLGKRLAYYSGYRCYRNQLESFEIPSGEKVQQIKKNVVTPDGNNYAEINRKLNELRNEAAKILTKLEALEIIPDPSLLRKELNKSLNKIKPVKENPDKSFFELYEDYILIANVSKGREKHLKSNLKKIKSFRPDTTFSEINEEYLKKLQDFLIDTGLSNNTVSTQMKMFSAFLNYAVTKEWTKENPFKKFKKIQEVYDRPISLSVEERDLLYSAKIDTPYLDRVREIFLFQCYVGCRIGDLLKLKKENIIDGCLEYIPEKTKNSKSNMVRVPLSDKAKEIIEKYNIPDGTLLPFISEIKYNEYIKKVFEKVGLKRMVTIKDPKTRIAKQTPLNEIAASHLARRTFIDILYQAGVKDEIIASMTGHVENSRSFFRYRKIEPKLQDEAIKSIG